MINSSQLTPTADDRYRVLILTADAGFGHRSAANAIAAAFASRYDDRIAATVVNPLDDPKTPVTLRNSQRDYDWVIQQAPELYSRGYKATDRSLPATVMDSGLVAMLYRTMRNILLKHQPDLIIATFPLYQAALDIIYRVTRRYIPIFTVVTDLVTVHRIWFQSSSALTIVPTQAVADLARKAGLPADSIRDVGIPVHPRLLEEQRSKQEIQAELGWDPDLTTLLIVSSKRVGHLDDGLRVLNHANLPLQLVVVAGGDDDFYDRLMETEWHQPAHIYNFIKNMPTLMRAADAVLCKAGGLITTESLAVGLPILLIDLLPGQEEGNADFVVDGGAGDLATDAINILEILHDWLADDGALFQERVRNARRLGRPTAALDIADMVWEALEGSLYQREMAPLMPTHPLARWLDRAGIRWQSGRNPTEP